MGLIPSIFPAADGRLREMHAAGMYGPAIGAALGICKETVYTRMRALGLVAVAISDRPTPAQVLANREAVLDLWRQGLSAPMIAKRLGWTTGTVTGIYNRAKKAGCDVARTTGTMFPDRFPKVKPKRVSKRRAPSNVVVLAPVESVAPRAPVSTVTKPRPSKACCWPMWGNGALPRLAPFCDAESVFGRPYCNAHCLVGYRMRPAQEVRCAA